MIKRIILSNFVKNKISKFISYEYVFTNFFKDDTWLFSQMKSGTTFLCNVIASYNSLILNGEIDQQKIAEQKISDLGVLRIPNTDLLNLVYLRQKFYEKHKYPTLIQTHYPFNFTLKNNVPKKTIILYRNPFDFTASYYFYFYKNTTDLSHLTINEVIQDTLEHYKKFYFQQKNILDLNKNCLVVSYENLITNKEITLKKIAEFYLDKSINSNYLIQAIESNSVENTKFMEEKFGRMLNKDNANKTSFIRSGIVGDYKNSLPKDVILKIENFLEKEKIPFDGSFI